MKHLQVVSLRLARESTLAYPQKALTNSEAVHESFRELVEDLDREAVWLLALDTKNRPVCASQISIGTLNSALVHPREVIKTALMASASAIILLHNHPSGDPTPSVEDQIITQKIQQAASLFGIRMLDHIIVGADQFYSFRDEGRLT